MGRYLLSRAMTGSNFVTVKLPELYSSVADPDDGSVFTM